MLSFNLRRFSAVQVSGSPNRKLKAAQSETTIPQETTIPTLTTTP